MKKGIIIIFAGLLSACSPKLAMPRQENIEKVVAVHPDYTLSDVKEGRTLYAQHCGSCHALKNPTAYTEEKWNTLVPIMSKKANKKAGKEIVTPQSSDKILKYLITMTTTATSSGK
ncbi:MAG: hypothetical protein K1X92_03565 [Bacteroidia bacterium]|nr:hypothetical protein [Bacteroidia bacterium]